MAQYYWTVVANKLRVYHSTWIVRLGRTLFLLTVVKAMNRRVKAVHAVSARGRLMAPDIGPAIAIVQAVMLGSIVLGPLLGAGVGYVAGRLTPRVSADGGARLGLLTGGLGVGSTIILLVVLAILAIDPPDKVSQRFW